MARVHLRKPHVNPKLQHYIDAEMAAADRLAADGRNSEAFSHLERAHVLGQSSTYSHTLVHIRMLKLGWRMRSPGEVLGQFLRIAGAATKTPFGIYPRGNTGGSNVWFFRRLPIPKDLDEQLAEVDA